MAACGYGPPRPRIPEGARTVGVEAFGSSVAHAEVAGWVADALRARVVTSPDLRLAAPSAADVVVRGEVVALEDDAIAFSAAGDAPAAVLAGTGIVVRARLVDRAGRVLADLGTVRARSVRSISALPHDDMARADRALRLAAEEAAHRIARQLLGL